MSRAISQRWERIRTVPGLGRDTAALSVMVVLGIISAILIQGSLTATLPWEDRYVLRAEFEEVPGVNPDAGHKVTIAGVRVGEIADWEATERGTAILTLNMEAGHKIYDNARAVLRPKNPLNDMTVEINPGGSPGKPLPENGLIPVGQTERPIQVDEILQNVDERSQQALTDLLVTSDTALVRMPQDLPQGLRATDGVLTGMRPVVEQLETRRKRLRELVTALAHIAGAVGDNDNRLTRLVDSTQQTLGVLANNDGALRGSLRQLPGLSADLRTTLTKTQRLTDQVNPTLDNLNQASEELPSALHRMRDTAGELGKTVDAAVPFVERAKPVVADLRPLVANVDQAFDDLRPITSGLAADTAIVTRYLEPISAFVYNTSSVFGAGDSKQTGVIRGHLVIPPDGAALPGGRGGYSPSPEESGVGGGN